MWRWVVAGRGTLTRQQFSLNGCWSTMFAFISNAANEGGPLMISGTPNPKYAWRFLLTGLFGICLTTAVFGQGNPAGPPPGVGPPPNKNPNVMDRSRQVNESELRGAEMNSRTDEEREKRVQAAIANMKEDFARIQVLRNDIARSLVARKPLDYELIRKQTAEINKRSSRMNVYLQAHAAQEEKENGRADLASDE